MDGMKPVPLPRDRRHRTQGPQVRARQQRPRLHEQDYLRKSNLPGIPGTACFDCDLPPSTKRLISSSRESDRENRTTRRFHTASQRRLTAARIMSASPQLSDTGGMHRHVAEVPCMDGARGACMDGARGAREKNLTFPRIVRVQPCIRPLECSRSGCGP